MSKGLVVALTLLVTMGEAAGAVGQGKKTLDALFATRAFSETVISPDGKRVAWVESLQTKEHAPSPNSAIYVASVSKARSALDVAGLPATGPPRRMTAGNGVVAAEHDVAWSPDGLKIAFLSDAEKKGQLQLYIATVAGGVAAHRVTSLKGFLADPKWSPDGKKLAVLFTENAPRASGPLEAVASPTGVIEIGRASCRERV